MLDNKNEYVTNLDLIIGEDIPNDKEVFNNITIYSKEEDNSLKLYGEIKFPYYLKFDTFVDSDEGLKYFFEIEHQAKTDVNDYKCMLIPIGEDEGFYRYVLNEPIKIRVINKPDSEIVRNLKMINE